MAEELAVSIFDNEIVARLESEAGGVTRLIMLNGQGVLETTEVQPGNASTSIVRAAILAFERTDEACRLGKILHIVTSDMWFKRLLLTMVKKEEGLPRRLWMDTPGQRLHSLVRARTGRFMVSLMENPMPNE